jgi:hypothetical protein
MNSKVISFIAGLAQNTLLGKVVTIACLGLAIGCSPAPQNSTATNSIAAPPLQSSPSATPSADTASRVSSQAPADPKAITIPDEKFTAQLSSLKDEALKEQYLATLKAFAEIPKERPGYQAVVEEMLQHQDLVFEMLNDCEYQDPSAIQRSEFYQIADRQFIVQQVCFLAAYNVSYAFFLYTGTETNAQVKPLKIATYEQDESSKEISQAASHLFSGFANYDEKSKELSLSRKYRGVGDCGITGQYQFQNNELVLQEFLADFECDGKIEFTKLYPQ